MTKVIFYTTTSENSPAEEFIDSLNEKQQRKIIRLLTAIQTYGLSAIIPHIKKLTGTSLWEIRILGQDNIRIFYVVILADTILVLHGLIKKTQQTPNKEINTAISRLNEWVERKRKVDF